MDIVQEHGPKYGELIICLDLSQNGYWRNDVYPLYKANRKKGRSVSAINFKEAFKEIDELTEQLLYNVPWKVVSVVKAEADDVMLVLAREYNKYEPILIHSPDKDMIQAQRGTNNVQQYSSLTKKWITPETKHGDMDFWVNEHVCLGDVSDNVPKIVDHTEFSDNFLQYLTKLNYNIKDPVEFKASKIDSSEKMKLLKDFNIYKTNRKGEELDEKDVYKDIRFGTTTLQKAIDKHGSRENWLASHPLYQEHFDRNYILVMEEGIPANIWTESIVNYKEAKTDYNIKEFEHYLTENKLSSLIMQLPNVFKLNHELTAEDFDW